MAGMRFVFGLHGARARFLLALLGCVLCLPALFAGLVLDDYLLAEKLVGADGSIRWQGLWDAFSFMPNHELVSLRETGQIPWWHDPELSARFLRPLAALTHAFDFSLLRRWPWLMHLESLTVLLALHISVGAWYARLFRARPRVAALAFSLYALAPGHAFAASWLANRNACLAALFAVLTLRAHDRARRERSVPFTILSLLALLLSLSSAELGVATLALLLAHTFCLDPAPLSERFLWLAPALLVSALWLLAYRAFGYGTHACSLYVDLASDPLAYLRVLIQRLPILLSGQWLLPITSLTALMSRTTSWVYWLLALMSLGGLSRLIVDALRMDAAARFSALAAGLALLPVAATVPHDRLLILADVGGLALVAVTAERFWASLTLRARVLRGLLRAHLAFSLLLTPVYAASLLQTAAVSESRFGALTYAEMAQQSLVFINPPCVYFPALLPAQRRFLGGPVPARVRTLVPGLYALEVSRRDAHTLVIRSQHGLLQPLGTWRSEDGAREPGWFRRASESTNCWISW
jgi:hypothetical protein